MQRGERLAQDEAGPQQRRKAAVEVANGRRD